MKVEHLPELTAFTLGVKPRGTRPAQPVEDDLAEQQAVVKAKQARRTAFEDLATDYLDLAETLSTETPPTSTALTRVLEFERDRDAHTYFDDRTTLLETAAKSGKE